MSYITPADVPISDTYNGHKNRPKPSAEPGTDYATAYGSDVRVAADGIVTIVGNSNSGAAGRRVSVTLTDGRRVSYIHLSKVHARLGQFVRAGQVIAQSGASGFGKDWYYGPHVHVSLWERPGMAMRDTIDFEPFTVDKGKDNEMVEDEEMVASFFNVQGKSGSHEAGIFAMARDNRGILFAKRFSRGRVDSNLPTMDNTELSEWEETMKFINK